MTIQADNSPEASSLSEVNYRCTLPVRNTADSNKKLAIISDEVIRDHPDADDILARETGWPSVIGMLRSVTDPRWPRYCTVFSSHPAFDQPTEIFNAAMIAMDDSRRAERGA